MDAKTSDPLHGTLSGTAPNLTYTPDANYHGSDSFLFKANDGEAKGEGWANSAHDSPFQGGESALGETRAEAWRSRPPPSSLNGRVR